MPLILQNRIEGPLSSEFCLGVFQLGGLWIAWELRFELVEVARWIVRGVTLLLRWICCIGYYLGYSFISLATWCHRPQRVKAAVITERGVCLTWMAAPGAGGAVVPVQQHPFPVGTFLLVSRPPVWDEVWIAGYLGSNTDILVRTTSSSGAEWIWAVVKLVAMMVKAPIVQADGTRRAPPGVVAGNVNWVYTPPDCASIWEPDAVEVISLSQEAALILSQLASSMNGVTINHGGVAGDLVPLVINAPAMGPAGGAGGGGAVGAAGLGMPSSGNSPTPAELSALEKAVQQLQAMAVSEDRKKDKKERKDKKSKKKSRKSSKKRSKKKKKKKRSRSSSTSSSSSSPRSRSRSNSSSSTSSSRKKPLAWKEKGKDHRVNYDDLCHVDQLRLKKKGDLLSFAAKNPGALTAHFLAGVYARLSKGTLARSSQLREASVAAWAQQHTGLTEPRDLKEVLTLAEILDHVNRREVARALDVLVQRIVAIQAAKAKGGSWEKAEALELVSTTKTLASSAMLALTNS